MDLTDKSILITGGSGSFGRCFAALLLCEHRPRRVIIYSRSELDQMEMLRIPPFADDGRVRLFIGDVRDKERLARALDGVDAVIHAAAMKQVPIAEYNPFEAVKTNVIGAQNLIDCAIDKGVRRVVALSTDKAANPVNLYGATKLCADKLFVSAASYVGSRDIRFSVVRYGNVIGSRGSVVPLYLEQRRQGELTVTDERMTRFWITLDRASRFVLDCLTQARGGELFVPKIPSMKVLDLARAIAPEARLRAVGIRPGEKLHEVLLPEDEARNAVELEDRYVLPGPRRHDWNGHGQPCPEGFRYASETNTEWLTAGELRRMVADLDLPEARQWAAEMGL